MSNTCYVITLEIDLVYFQELFHFPIFLSPKTTNKNIRWQEEKKGVDGESDIKRKLIPGSFNINGTE